MSRRFNRPARPSSDSGEQISVLYRETSGDLFAFLLRRCRTTNDAADCMAETYRIAWEKRDRIPPGDQARPWLFGVARNVARRERTRDERAEAISRELALITERSAIVTEPEDSASTAALSELSALDREIVTMLAWDELTPREIATILGLSPNAVRVRAYKARIRLRASLTASIAEDHTGTTDTSSTTASHGR